MKLWEAFTLIELLIVVAIIAILAAVGLPNFLEAQTRARVSRVLADHRALVTAMQAYHVDHNAFPPDSGALSRNGIATNFFRDNFVRWRLIHLTTPVSYMTELPTTPFWTKHYKHSEGVIEVGENHGSEFASIPGWYNNAGPMQAGAMPGITQFHFRDPGPDFTWNNQDLTGDVRRTNLMPYDPTNGTVSWGDIWRFGP